MINTRRKFLTAFFTALEANGVRYCILRNYDDLYADISTDVDMIVSPYSLKRFERCLRETADQTGFHFVHAARYVNYSFVFWHPVAKFVRIDFETDLRWRLFTVLSTRAMLDARRRHEEFFIPHPEHESVVIFVAAIWRGYITPRYRAQLAILYRECSDKESLRKVLIRAFGPVGETLAAFQAQAESASFDGKFCNRVRWGLMMQSHLSWARVADLIHNTASDCIRFWERLRRPAGISFLYVSSHKQPRDFDELKREINFLFPEKKCVFTSFDLTRPGSDLRQANWNWALRSRRLWTMFKGGLFVRAYRLAKDQDLPRVARTYARYIFARRTFMCVEDSAGRLYFAHIGSGFMSTIEPESAVDGQNFSRLFIEFISAILERESAPLPAARPQRGLFCVLVGLDGSGKTTLGRNLCDVSLTGSRFRGIRYFHWRPKVFNPVEFPLPEFKDTPRKPAEKRTIANSITSLLRISKNALLSSFAWHLRVRPLLKRGYLVIVDRYFYNYRLDPASVKFTGSPAQLDFMENFFPCPDLVVKLRAPREVLLARKRELSDEEIIRQAKALDDLTFDTGRTVVADATQPANEVARNTMAEITRTVITP